MPCPTCGGRAVTVTRKIGNTSVVLCDLDHAFVERRRDEPKTSTIGDAVVFVLGICVFVALWVATPG